MAVTGLVVVALIVAAIVLAFALWLRLCWLAANRSIETIGSHEDARDTFAMLVDPALWGVRLARQRRSAEDREREAST